MQRIALIAFLSIGLTEALAHPSVVPHQHPHGALPSLDVVLVAAALAALGIIIFRKLR